MKKLTLLLFAMLTICSASAQETVKLTVNGQGATKEEATANALRSAIEQSFGVFVSANTQILNDEVVKDEIATISSGNIQEYKELGCITMPNGEQSVTLSATVSIGNLISYAKSKGSSAEFAGAIFAMNIKMRKLNAENEKMAIEHMLEQLHILAKDMFRIEMNVYGQPIKVNSYNGDNYSSQPYFVNMQLRYYSTPTCKLFYDLLFNSLQSISLSEDEVRIYKESGEPIYGLSFRQAINEDIQIFGIGRRDLSATTAYADHYNWGEKEFTLSVYYFRNDIVDSILSSIYKFWLDAQLSGWQIQANGINEIITFASIERESGLDRTKTDCFHWYWESSPYKRKIECVNTNNGFGGNSFPFVDTYNYFAYGEEQIRIRNLQKMLQDSNEIATRNIKIAFSEDELAKITGFEIKKRENREDHSTPHNYEIWYTNGRTTEPIASHHTYDTEKECWVITFNESVTSIEEGVFSNCSSLTSVTIPESVTSIGTRAFSFHKSLTSVTIPDGVTTIGDYAFKGCTSLTSVTIPESVTTIGEGAFNECSSLTSVTIPDSVTSIGKWAFSWCTSLTSVTIPDSVTTIEEGAFKGCSSLTSVTIPESVTTIGEGAFNECSSLTSVTIPDSVTTIGEDAFKGCTSLTSVTIPDSVTTIGDYAFYNCSSLTSVTIPESVTSIGNWAFSRCTSLTSVTIPDSVTTIGDYAFSDCTSLTSVTIGNSVTTIGYEAFNSCSNLKTVYCKPTTPPEGSSGMFYGNASDRKIYVPEGSVSAYKSRWRYNADKIFGWDTTAAQDGGEFTESSISDEIFFSTEKKPTFQGGDISAFLTWLHRNIVWPKEAQEKGITGRVVFSIVVEKDGSVTNFNVLRSPDKSLTDETKRVLRSSPKWTAGENQGEKVRVQIPLFVTFDANTRKAITSEEDFFYGR